jgi:hypothetical protein
MSPFVNNCRHVPVCMTVLMILFNMFLQLVFADIGFCTLVTLPLLHLMISAIMMVQKTFIGKLPVANFAFEITVLAISTMDGSFVILKFAFVRETSAALSTLPFLRLFGFVVTIVFFARVRITNMALENMFGRVFFGTLGAFPFF